MRHRTILFSLVITLAPCACAPRALIGEETGGTGNAGGNSESPGDSDDGVDGGDDWDTGEDGNEPYMDIGGAPLPWDVGTEGDCDPSTGPAYACCRDWDDSLCGIKGSYGFSDACVSACMCAEPCATDPACPPPSSGTAEPYCDTDDGHCRLPCGEGITCPDGMSCEPPGEASGECYWIVEYPQTYECWSGRDPDVCAQHETREQCEADLAGDPPWGCIWVSETIFAAGTVTCEPQGTEERCVPAERDEAAGCEDERRCAPTRPAVYWSDLGAGTATLVEVESCAYVPTYDKNTDRTYEPCFIGDPSIPLVCDCACE